MASRQRTRQVKGLRYQDDYESAAIVTMIWIGTMMAVGYFLI
jgi:hypothetical protein